VNYEAPSPPYLGPAKFHGGADNKPVDRVVMHSTVGPTKAGSARGIAKYFRESVTRPSSAHYVVDADEVVQVVYDSVVAYHAPPNTHSIGVEMCDMPATGIKAVLRWWDADHRAMIRQAARLVAGLCLAYDVPVQFVKSDGLRAGKRGITTHAQVSGAWHETTHWDPGAWPRGRFMRRVRREVKALRKAAK
jgi:N-acetylmuramoyl-L-alanine amidase CwlA